MPNIPIYLSKAQIAGPANQANATAEGFGAGVGRALEGAGQTIRQVTDVLEQRQAQREISKINAATTKTTADLSNELTTDLNQSDPNNDKFTEQFGQKVQDRLSPLQEMATTREAKDYLTKTTSAISSHFQERAFAGQTELAGLAAKNNYLDSLNSASSAVVADPSQLGFFIQHQDETLNAMVASGSMSRAQALELQAHSHEEVAKSAVLGLIQKNPQYAKSALEKGEYDKYIDGTAKAALIGHADQQIKAQEVDARLAAEEARRAKKDAADAKMGDWLGQIVQRDPQNPLTAKDVLADPNVDHQDKEHFLRLLGYISENGANKTDPQVMSSALHRAYLPPSDPNALTEDEVKQGAGTVYRSPEEINQLFGAIQQRKTTEGRQENDGFNALEAFAKKNLGGSAAGIPDPAGDALVSDFMFKAKALYDQQRKSGKTMEQLLSATSPDFIGRYLQVPTAKERSMRYISAFKGGALSLSTSPTLNENLPIYTPQQAAGLPSGTRFKGTDGVTRTKQ